MPTELEKKLKAIATARFNESEAQAKAKSYADEASSLSKEVAELVKAGVSTGDSIQDHVLMRGFGPNTEREKLLRQLEAELAGRTGELVMLLYTVEVRSREGDRREARALFGVLRGDRLVYKDAPFGPAPGLPVESYAERMYDSIWKLKPGPILESPGNYGVRFLVLKPLTANERIDFTDYKSYVLAGTKAVREFVKASYTYRIDSHELFGFTSKESMEDVFESLGLPELTG